MEELLVSDSEELLLACACDVWITRVLDCIPRSRDSGSAFKRAAARPAYDDATWIGGDDREAANDDRKGAGGGASGAICSHAINRGEAERKETA